MPLDAINSDRTVFWRAVEHGLAWCVVVQTFAGGARVRTDHACR